MSFASGRGWVETFAQPTRCTAPPRRAQTLRCSFPRVGDRRASAPRGMSESESGAGLGRSLSGRSSRGRRTHPARSTSPMRSSVCVAAGHKSDRAPACGTSARRWPCRQAVPRGGLIRAPRRRRAVFVADTSRVSTDRSVPPSCVARVRSSGVDERFCLRIPPLLAGHEGASARAVEPGPPSANGDSTRRLGSSRRAVPWSPIA